MKKSSLKNRPVHPLIEELEPRILFSAGLEGIVLDSLTPDDDAFALYQHKDETTLQPTSAVATEAVVLARQELVFIDTNTPDYQKLVDDLLANNEEDRTFQWVLIESNKDGIQQITDSLANYNNLDAVHIISHGSDGTVQLGNKQLDLDSLHASTDAINNWGKAFNENGDLLFYGCNLAATEEGQSLINSLAKLTGADIAASDDLTGSTSLGGDWVLEYNTDTIESKLAFSGGVQQDWSNVLVIGVDTTSTGQTTGSGLTISHTTSGTDRLLLVSVSKTNPGAESVTSITYNGSALTLLGRVTTPDTQAQIEIWALTAPDTGTHDVVVTMDGANASGTVAGVMTFTGVDQITSLGTFASASNNASTTATVDVSSAAGELVFSAVTAESAPDIALTVGADQTEHWELYQSGDNNSAGSTEAGAAIVTASWGLPASNQWAIAGVSIKPYINTAPTDISISSSSVNENTDTSSGYSVGTLSTTDPDTGESHSYTIVGGADMGKFTIGGGGSDELILTDGILDFETQSSYQVIVRTTDNGSPNLSYDETLTITVNDQTGNISGTVFTDEGTTNIGAGKTISLLVNGVNIESAVTGAGGAYSFTSEASTGDAVAVFIDNDVTYKGVTVTVSDGTDLGGVQVYADHIVVRNDNGGVISIADMDNALGAYSDTDMLYSVSAGNLIANAANSELYVPAGHTFIPGGDVSANNIKILGTVNAGANTFAVSGDWDSTAGTWIAGISTVNLTGTGTLNSAGGSFFNLTTGAASQVTTLTSDLTVTNVLTIADSTGTLTDNGGGYDITVTGTGTPFVNNGAAVTAKNFIYRYPTDATITAAGGTYNVTESLWIAGSGTGSGTTYQLNGDLLVTGEMHVYATSFGVSILDTLNHNITANSLQVSNSSFQVGFLYANNSTIDINGDVDFVNSVTTVVDLGSSDFSVYGNWTNNSNTFNAGSSTVTFDGGNQNISGSSAFYNFTKIESTDDATDSSLIFDNTATQTINGTLTLDGLDADDRINLISNVPGNQWSINLTASAAHALNYIVVTDSDASGSDPSQLTINPANSFSGGNNIGWFGATAGDDAYSVDEGSTTNLDLSANDSDADGLDLASIIITSGPTNGSITVNANGTVDYTHDDSETVSDSFTYTINDTLSEVSNIATVTLTINPVNEAPVVNDQIFNIDENRPMNNVVGTPVVTDPDTGDSFTYSITGGTGATAFSIHATNGQIRVADPSQINFETNPVLTLDIQVQDAGGLIDTATITININDLNERPTLNDTTFTIDENSVNGTSVGSMVGTDPDGGDSITYSIVGGNIGNAFTIDPVTGEITVNDFSMLNFEAIGIPGNPAFASQTGAANPFNGINVGNRSTPAFVDIDGDGDLDAFVGKYDGILNFFENIGDATNPIFVAVSGPGNPLDGFDTGSRSTPTFADIDNDGDQDLFVGDRFGAISYYQNIGNATSPSFVQVTGPGNPLNGVNVSNMSAPTFIDIDGDGDLDAFVGEWYGTVKYFENTGDAANPAFTQQTGAANPLSGVFAPLCCNEWTPKPVFADLDDDGDYDAFIGLKNGSTEYWENTGDAASPVFSLQPGDANPLRTAYVGNEAAPAFVDIDNDGDLDVFSGNSFGAIRYFENTPVFNLTVQAEDSSGLTDTAIVRIDLNDVNDGPTDIDLSNNLIDEFVDTSGGYSVGTLSTTDEDDGDNHTYTIVGGADAALFSIGGTGSDELIFDDGILDFETQSSYQVMVRVTDGGSPGLVHDETFTINVNDLNDAPVSNNASASGNEDDTSIAITLTGSDVDGTVDNFQLSTLPANGTLYTDAGLTTVAVTGMDYAATAESLTLYFVPSPNYNGVTNFQFVARDNGGLLDATPAITTITVNPVNDAPVAVDNGSAGMLITTAEDTAVNIDVVGNDTDVDGTIDPTTVVINTGPVNGTININAITGMVSYTPDSNFNGTDTFSYQVRDDSGALSNVASVYLDVTPVNDAPIVTGPATAGTASIWAPLVLSSSNGNAISIADIDDANAIVEVTLAVSNGDLTLSKTTGLSFTTGDGINDTTMTFTGTLADANAALDGLKMQAGDGFQSTDNLTISVNDMGNTGGSPLTASRTITVNIDSLSPNTSDSPDPDSTPSDTDSDPIEVDESEPESNDTPPDPELALEPDTTTQGQQRVLPAGNEASDKPVTESEYVKAIVEKITEIPVDLLESALNKIDIPKSVPQLISNFALWTAIDSMFDELDNSFSDTQTQEAIVANVIRGTTWSLSAGFVAWILRGGSLIAAAMSSIPIWKGLDPLPIIAMSKRERERLEEEKLVDKQEEDSLQQEIGELIDGARLVNEQVENDTSEDQQP